MAKRSKADHPYLASRYNFEQLLGDLASGRRSWQVFAIVLLVANVVLATGLAHVAAQRKVVPYIVELDALGEMRATGILDRHEIPERAIMAVLKQFVHNLRTVPTDARLFNIRLQDAKTHVKGRAAEMLIQQLGQQREQLERMLQRGYTRYVEEISVVLKVPGQGQLYRVVWRESTRTGAEVKEEAFEGHFQLQINVADDEAQMDANPLGIYVTDFTWTTVATMSNDLG